MPSLPTSRLLCLDVFRGLAVAGMIIVDNPGNDDLAYGAIKHTVWNGWTPADFIFPSFMFLVGASMVLSYQARLERGESKKSIFFHSVRRTLILIALGLFINGIPTFPLSTWRIEGVLQRIAVCYLVAGVLVLWTNWRGQLAALAICLVGYWALLRFVPVPGFGLPGRDIPFMDQTGNLVAWLDRTLFPGRLYDGIRDPEGLISNIPALGTTLLGVLTGHWLRSGEAKNRILVRMVLFSSVVFAAGLTCVLHTFLGGSEGSQPSGRPLVDASGKVFGTTLTGGTGTCQNYLPLLPGCGTVFQLQ